MLDAYRDLIDGLTEESTTLRQKLGTPVPDSLSAETVSLLKVIRAREGAMMKRAQKVARGENVNLRAMENEPAVKAADELTQSPEELVAEFQLDRGELVSTLINLTLKDWERKVPHWVLGETTIADEVEEHLTWEEESLDRLDELMESAG